MPEIDESGGMLPGTSVVQVDVSGLDAFAASIEAELEANFQPQTVRLMKTYETGSHFGIGHASSDVAAAQAKHNECLRAAMRQLVELARATGVLADAARTVAARYRDSDAMAASNALEAMRVLHETAKSGGAVESKAINSVPATAPPSADGGRSYG